MTKLSNGTIVTDLDAHDDNLSLSQRGYSIRHIETWHDHDNQPSSTGTRQNCPKLICPTEHGKRGRPTWVGPSRMYHQAVRYVKPMNAAITDNGSHAPCGSELRHRAQSNACQSLWCRGEKATALRSVRQPRRQTEPIQSLSRRVL